MVGGSTFNYNTLSNSYVFTSLTPGTSNKITVKAKCDGVFSDKSVKVTINTPLKCGTMENTVSIYPNPVTQIIYAEGCEEFKLMELFTLEGKLVEHSVIISPKSKMEFNVEGIANGIYLIKLSGDSNVHTEKVIISK